MYGICLKSPSLKSQAFISCLNLICNCASYQIQNYLLPYGYLGPTGHDPGGRFTNVSRALQNNLAKINNARNYIYGENSKLKLCTCAQSMALGTPTKFQLEILIRSVISAIHKFRENILESSRNISETTPWSKSSTGYGCRIKTGSGGVCCHNARGRVRNRKSNPDGVAGGIWRTVRTSPSALWQQTPTDRS